MGAAGTVMLGGAAAVTYAGQASPTLHPIGQTGSTGSSGTGATTTSGGEYRHHASSSVPIGQLDPSTTIVTPGNPGSGLVTSGGS